MLSLEDLRSGRASRHRQLALGVKAFLVRRGTNHDRREHRFAEKLAAQIEVQRVDHNTRTEGDAVEGLAVTSRDRGVRGAAELALGHGFEFQSVDELVVRGDAARRLSFQARRLLRP